MAVLVLNFHFMRRRIEYSREYSLTVLYRLVCKESERFEPRSHFKSRLSLIVRVNVALNRTVVVDND